MSIRKVKNHSEKNTKLKIQKAGSRDRQPVMSILKRTGFFRDCELKTAQEVFVQSLLNPRKNGYYSIVAKNGTKTIGWICYGPTPCTLGTFDIYWIAVEPQFQRDGIGTALTGFAETKIKRKNGRLITIDTSSQKRYRKTRRFYEKNGYKISAVVKNFYAPGDNKVIYTKSLASQ